MMQPQSAGPLSERTAWGRNLETPLREFLRTETGSAAVLLAATIAALVWANVDSASYQRIWGTELSVRVGGAGVSQDLRQWVNAGLMTFFFFVVGLEARREFDLGGAARAEAGGGVGRRRRRRDGGTDRDLSRRQRGTPV